MNLGNPEAMLIITPILIIGTIMGGTFLIIQVILNHRIKMRLINTGNVDENSVKLLQNTTTGYKFHSLKWGLILLFGGIGLILLQYIPYKVNSPLPFGIEAVSIAIGYLVYYGLTRNELDKQMHIKE